MPEAAYDSVTDLGTSPQAVARRWKLELHLAGKREEAWRKRGTDILKQYTPDEPKNNSFNILWTNTETLRQACYNSLPQPQVRRRYQDEDPLGRAVSVVLQRALEFSQEQYDLDAAMKGDVLSMLLPGRAVSRVRYVPSLRQVGAETDAHGRHDEESEEPTHEAQEGPAEEIDWEQVVCERIQWDDLRIGPGKTWDEVEWVAFRHRLKREDLVEKFGEEGQKVQLDTVADEDVIRQADLAPLFKTAEVWEIWCREEKSVYWIAQSAPKPLKVQPDPLQLAGFFPIPRPLYAIENASSLVPAALYTQYEQQAKELNRISGRINKIIDALRVRGIYDATLTELSELMKGADNELIPAANVTALLERGGLERAIWMMPIDTAASVLRELYAQREATKAVIYEITGIADIMRAATNPNETFGAQRIKTQWGTQRLQRLQREVQRYIRDVIRLMAEVISQKFQPETLAAMTLVQLPTEAQLQQQYLMAAQQAQMQGQPPPPPPTGEVTWEAVMRTLRDDATRTYHIDIETDSTISASQDDDLAGLKDVLSGLVQLLQGFGPVVQSGAMSVDVLKELAMVVVRRARMGSAVEDAFNKMQQPPPPPPDQSGQLEQAKFEAQAQLEQAKHEATVALEREKVAATMQVERMKAELDVQAEQGKQAAQAAQLQHQNELEAARKQQEAQLQHALSLEKLNFERWKAELDSATRIEVARIAQNADPATIELAANAHLSAAQAVAHPMLEASQATTAALEQLIAHLARPKRIVRDANGRALGVE